MSKTLPHSPCLALGKKFEQLDLSYEKAARYLADRGVEVSGSYLSMLVRGLRYPSVSMAKQIAEALDLQLSDIVGK